MPTTITLPSKFIEDENGSKFAPITTPNAIRFPDGTNLNDHLGDGSVIPVVLLYEPSILEVGMVMFDAGETNKFYQYQYNGQSRSWVEISTPHKAIGVGSNNDWYEIIDGVLSQTPMAGFEDKTWYIYYIGGKGVRPDHVMFFDEYGGGGVLPTFTDMINWNNKQDAITFNSTYDATTNPAATMADIPSVGLPVGSGTVTSLASLPVTNRMIVATISANQSTVSISNGVSALTAGCELHVIVKATAAVTITLPTSSPYINMNADTTLSLAANSYAEINFISDGTNIYVRAIS